MPHKVLMVDDNELDYLVIKKILESQHYDILYNNAKDLDIWKLIGEELPDCILLDLSLNMLSGLDILNDIRAKDPHKTIPVAMLTAERDPDIIIKCMKSGADDYLIKGRIEKERIIAVVKNLLEKNYLHKQLKQLQTLLPICAWCKKIRKDGGDPTKQNSWEPIEHYLEEHGTSNLSHGICPECKKNHFEKK